MPEHRIPIVMNLGTLQLQGPLKIIDLTDIECRLLLTLSQSPASRQDMAPLLTQSGLLIDDLGKRALGVRMVRLRKKLLAAGASHPTIKSIRGTGYQLCVPLQITSHQLGIDHEKSAI